MELKPLCMSLLITWQCVLQTAVGYNTMPRHQYIRLSMASLDNCHQGAPCRYSVCMRARSLFFNPKTCIFVDSGCTCPENKRCTPTANFVSRSGYIKMDFTCRDQPERDVDQEPAVLPPQLT